MDMPWKHDLIVFEPAQLKHPEHVLLFITGGSNKNKPKLEDKLMGSSLATLSGTRVALLFQVPNQPLLGGKTEDDLITDTFLFYLATSDARWPLLFPMAKSAVRAMDCVEQLAAQEWKSPVKGFVVTGASKRGWTTWLTAVCDQRVRGIAPLCDRHAQHAQANGLPVRDVGQVQRADRRLRTEGPDQEIEGRRGD